MIRKLFGVTNLFVLHSNDIMISQAIHIHILNIILPLARITLTRRWGASMTELHEVNAGVNLEM
jgi:hypothetical protein